jgi:hypothetical protein
MKLLPRLALVLVVALGACTSSSSSNGTGGSSGADAAAGGASGSGGGGGSGGAIDAQADAAMDLAPAGLDAADGPSADAGSDAGSFACGDASCSPGQLCVTDQTVGGAFVPRPDGGSCAPPLIVVSEAPNSCSRPPNLHCSSLPPGCASACSCRAQICQGSVCTESGSAVRCVTLAP